MEIMNSGSDENNSSNAKTSKQAIAANVIPVIGISLMLLPLKYHSCLTLAALFLSVPASPLLASYANFCIDESSGKLKGKTLIRSAWILSLLLIIYFGISLCNAIIEVRSI